jgi:hypothetical protein
LKEGQERRTKLNILKKDIGPFPLGVWIALAVLLAVFLGWGMQAYSLLNWDDAVDLGFQNERFTGDAVERAWAHESWSVAMADLLWPLPIGIVAFIGLLRKRLFGFAACLMEFAISVYFPLVFAFTRWATYRGTAFTAVFLWAVPSLIGIVCLWANRRYFYK